MGAMKVVVERHCLVLEWPDGPMESSAEHFLYERLGRVSTRSVGFLV